MPTLPKQYAKDQTSRSVVPTIKTRLKMYGITPPSSGPEGRKAALVTLLQASMGTPVPWLGLGSWYHYDKVTTATFLEKYCHDNHIEWNR